LSKNNKLKAISAVSVSLGKIEDTKLLFKIHNASVKGGFF